jgi:hypothetical protein
MKLFVGPLLGVLCAMAMIGACGGKELSPIGGGNEGGTEPEGGSPPCQGPCGLESGVGEAEVSESGFFESGTGFDGESFESGESDSGGGDGSFGEDAESEAGVSCKPGTGTIGMGSGGSCTTEVSEKCSNGFTYTANCSCPKRRCDCTAMSGSVSMGSSDVPYKGCSSDCSNASAAWEACGFPQ